MIIKFVKPGRSFKGVTLYLMHDPNHATTSERVAWTHTLNLAHDHIESAVHEMVTTCLDAELLKAEAGVRAGSGTVEKPVKHISLSWQPGATPDREEMIRTAQSFLGHMGWSEHQTILIGHDDKEHRHVHLVVNAIHPVTGLKLRDAYEWRRAEAWGLAYEQEQGAIVCPQRLKPIAEREASEPRPAWIAIREQVEREHFAEKARNAFDPSYMGRAENRRDIERGEWQILKELQKQERLAFFDEGKQVYKDLSRAVYREVREEFRPEWASYYAAKRDGLEFHTLAEIRAGLIARQKEVLEERREAAAAELRAARDQEYRELLDAQKEQRGELIDRQERGLSSPHLLAQAYPAKDEQESVREASEETSALDRFGIRRGRSLDRSEAAFEQQQSFSVQRSAPDETPGVRSPVDAASGLAGGLLSIIGALSESMTGGHTRAPRRPAPEDALERFSIQRGRPPPDAAQEQAARDKAEREAWDAWKKKREILMDK
jgi:hypothetical protein